nr:MAG TPA_asm: hypothetical protein [Caudoviricetes sp.]
MFSILPDAAPYGRVQEVQWISGGGVGAPRPTNGYEWYLLVTQGSFRRRSRGGTGSGG